MSKFGELISQAKVGNEENRKTGKPENRKTINNADEPETEIKSVNLSIKVPENYRRHWAAEAKRQGTSITAEITEALKNRFGAPEQE